jgi:hypothetical protein
LRPEKVAGEIQGLLGVHRRPGWSPPQPWQLRDELRRLAALSELLAQPQAGTLQMLADAMEPFWEEQLAAARGEACRLLAQSPVGGPARLAAWLDGLQAETAELADRAAARHEREDAPAFELAATHAALEETIAKLLESWPASTTGAWLGAAMRPWRWPELIWTYGQLHQAGRELSELVARRAELERQQATTAAMVAGYGRWQAALRELESQAEELADLLADGREALVNEASATAAVTDEAVEAVLEALYGRLVEGEMLEAEQAAEAVGGLERLFLRPEGGLAGALMAAGRERMAAVLGMTAVDALQLQLTTPEEVAAWWQQLWDAAAPLWHCDEARRPEAWQVEPVERAAVLADGAWLREMVQLPELAEVRWLEAEAAKRIVVVRLSGSEVRGWATSGRLGDGVGNLRVLG